MKLQTSIPPRRDGTLSVRGLDGKDYAFAPGPDGELVGDVDHAPTIKRLLAGDNFYPADPADYDAALALTGNGGPGPDDPQNDGDLSGEDDDDDDGTTALGHDDGSSEDGYNEAGDDASTLPMPVEANTPPAKPKAAGKAKGGKAKA